MTRHLIILFLFLFLRTYSQVDYPVDTAEVKGLKEIIHYEKRKGLLKYNKRIGGIKEFDQHGRIVRQQIFVNRTDIPEFQNRFYYNDNRKISRKDHLMYDEEKKEYIITDSTFYFYTKNNLDSIKHYEFDRLDGVIYTDLGSEKVAKYWQYNSDSLKIKIFRTDYYNSKGQEIKNISQTDTNYFFYDQYGRDSLHYFVNIGEPHSQTTYSYSKQKKTEHIKGILFPADTFDKIYSYNKKGNRTAIKYKLKGEKSFVKDKYYSNGLLKKNIIKVKKKSKSDSFEKINYYIYKLY